MAENILYRPAVQTDIPQMMELMNRQYNQKKSTAYFEWQYFLPFQPTVSICAFVRDKLVGMFGLQKRRLHNRNVTVGQAIDLLVAPEWQRQGIFTRLGQLAAEYFNGLDILCVLPNLDGKNACERALGWKTLGKIDSLYLDSRSELPVSAEALEHSEYHGEDTLVRFEYSAELRSWRFRANPDYHYADVSADSGVFAVTKIFADSLDGKRYGDILDFECDRGNGKALAGLFAKASGHLIGQGVEGVITWALPHTPLYPVLKSLGFARLPQERYFCVKVLNLKCEYLNDVSVWHLVQADAELY
jgi:GNAT superfamily N-acetyltransferase